MKLLVMGNFTIILVILLLWNVEIEGRHLLGVKGTLDKENCKKEEFSINYVTAKKRFAETALKALKSNCKADIKGKCKRYPGTLSATYGEDSTGALFILFKLAAIIEQDCWGYVLNIDTSDGRSTHYFNFEKNKEDFKHYVNVALGARYNFTVIALPTGKPLSLITRAPTSCQLNVMDQIYYKLKEKSIFKNCQVPGYVKRRDISENICQMFPEDQNKMVDVLLYVRSNLSEENCEFVLLPDNRIGE